MRFKTRNDIMKAKLISKRYALPFALITTLFFLWGFARAILDVLNKHFQSELSISITRSTMIQTVTYLGYFLMAIPAGIMITRRGYRRGVVTGLICFGVGALMFIPGAAVMSFPLFLTALFIIGCGLAMLETAANPYAAELGAKETAASRLNLAQSFNGLGCIVAPALVGGFLFSDPNSSVATPYTILGIVVLVAAVCFSRADLPEIKTDDAPASTPGASRTLGQSVRALWSRRGFRLGILALFCYEIAEISINSLFINYATYDGWLTPAVAARILSFGALALFMAARVIGSFVMSKIAAEKVLLFCALMTVLGACTVALDLGAVSKAAVFVCYAFEAIMFPTIFAITIAEAGDDVKIASSFCMMTPIGGAVGTFLMGLVADSASISSSFLIPAAGYAFVLVYAVRECMAKPAKTRLVSE
jgi:hypothetical protein